MTFYEDFSEAEWTALLHNEQIFKYDNILIMRRLMDIGGEATCSQLANEYGRSWGYYNSMCSKLAKRIADFKQIELDKRPNGQEIRWPILFMGKNDSAKDDIDGSFIWTLKSNLRNALEKMNLSEYEPLHELGELDKLYEEFNQRFPIEKLESLPLEQYTNLDGDYFCTWVERKTQKLGSIQGSTSFKFGIYKYKKVPKDRSGQMYDGEYAWLSKFGEKRDEVYLAVREKLVQVAQAARNGNFEVVDKSKFYPMFKWKVAFLYSEKKLIPIYDKKMLVYIASQKGMSDAKSAEVSQIQKYLLNVPGRNPDLWEYYKELLEIWKAKEPQYFVAKITDAPNVLKNAIQNKYWAMQQRYGVQKSAAVTNNFKPILQMQTGDILFLGDGNRLLAYGKVKKVEYDTENVLSLKDTIGNKRYEDIQEDGYVIFEDCDVYYEKRYEGYEEDWSQFINVEEWESLCENSEVTTAGVGKAADMSVNSIFQVKDSKWAGDKMKELDEQFNKTKQGSEKMIDGIKNLLLKNHNIILHGAPGTGKTYLAKEIAKAMDCGDNEIGFVQFHQSYDYTDFVEGLRPVQKTDSTQIFFEKKDGIFKAFCMKAQKNFKDSAKSEKAQSIEAYWTAKVDTFLDAVMDGEISQDDWKTSKKENHFTISSDDSNIFVSIPENPIKKEVDFPKETLVQLLSYNLDLKKVVDVRTFYNRKHGAQSDSYAYVLYHKIKDWITKKEDIPKIKNVIRKKDYVFIIDEINRGEMSKIFGELFFSIDPGYRGKNGDVRTQYANLQKDQNEFDKALGIVDSNNFGHFFVPENVYIIGTMNDIDRSVESMDFAMRRRFAFEEVTAEQSMSMFDDPKSWKDENDEVVNIPNEILTRLKNRMRNLNTAILNPKLNLGQAYQIGGAYFLKFAKYFKDGEGKAFADLWKYHLKGLLTEYLRGMPKSKESLDKLEEAYKDVVDHRSNVQQGQPS